MRRRDLLLAAAALPCSAQLAAPTADAPWIYESDDAKVLIFAAASAAAPFYDAAVEIKRTHDADHVLLAAFYFYQDLTTHHLTAQYTDGSTKDLEVSDLYRTRQDLGGREPADLLLSSTTIVPYVRPGGMGGASSLLRLLAKPEFVRLTVLKTVDYFDRIAAGPA